MTHECIHILDFKLNHDAYVNRMYYNGNYNPHGEWFQKKSREFDKYGFNVEQQTVITPENLNKNNENIMNMFKNELNQICAIVYTMSDGNVLFSFVYKDDIDGILDIWASRRDELYTFWNHIERIEFRVVNNVDAIASFKMTMEMFDNNRILTRRFSDGVKEFGEFGDAFKTVTRTEIETREVKESVENQKIHKRKNGKYQNMWNMDGVVDIEESGRYVKVTIV